MQDSIQLAEIKVLPHQNRPLKGFASVKVGDWVIHDFRIVQQDHMKVQIIPPQVSWKDPDTGEIKFKGILTIPSVQKQKIEILILHAYQMEVEKKDGKLFK
jgi:hypothetical protein